MNFSFNAEQEELRRSARAFLRDHSASENVRSAMESTDGYDHAVWTKIATELGWPALTIPEEFGGIGWGPVELVALMEETGAALLCSPLFSTVCLGAAALSEAGTEDQKNTHLPSIAAGESTATLAITEASGAWDASGIQTVARPSEGGGFVLSGTKRYVLDGATSDLLIVAAREEGCVGEEGISLFVIPSSSAGVTVTALPTMDQTRRLAEIEFKDVEVGADALMGTQGQAWPSIAKVLNLAAIALAAEQVGGAERLLNMTVEYAKERKQFKRPIGSFQAIKHKCADMLLEVESARSAVYYAAWAASVGDPELPTLASLAKAYCSDAFFHCAAESVQIHGGVGFTWELDVHLFFKRAKSTESFLGTPAFHRELVAQQLEL